MQLQFIVQRDPAAFSNQLEEMLTNIGNELPLTHTESTIQKCRWILTEFITNDYKHAGSRETVLNIEFFEKQVLIIKEDSGKPMQLRLHSGEAMCWPITAEHFNSKACIIKGELNELHVAIDKDGTACFTATASAERDEFDYNNLNEHFGLIIIAKLCNSFTYSFDIANSRNVFKALVPDQ